MAWYNISISTYDSEGYGISLFKNFICKGETVRADIISPGASLVLLWFMNDQGGMTLIKGYNLTSSKTIQLPFNRVGAYYVELQDTSGNTKQTRNVYVKSTCEISPTPTPTITTPTTGNGLVGASNKIMSIPWIGLVLLIVVIFGVVKHELDATISMFIIALTTSIEAVIGLWQEWAIYITVLSWLLVGVFFKFRPEEQ